MHYKVVGLARVDAIGKPRPQIRVLADFDGLDAFLLFEHLFCRV
jgi:hypothetical protein